MTRQGNRSRSLNTPLSAIACDPRVLPRPLQYLHIIRKSKTSIRAMKYIPTWTNFIFLVGELSIIFCLRPSPTSTNSTSAALTYWPLRIVLSAIYNFESGRLDSRSLIRVTQYLNRRSHCSGFARSLVLMLMDCASSLIQSLTVLSLRCVVKPPDSAKSPRFLPPIGLLQQQGSQPRHGLVELASGLYWHLRQLISATRNHQIIF